jgi:ribosomal protein L11 methyltransferase
MSEMLRFYEFTSPIEFSGMLGELIGALPYQSCVNDDLETKLTSCRVYYQTENEGKELHDALKQNISQWRKIGIECTEPESGSIENEDWQEVWKRHFKIQHITDNFVIKASWLDYERKGSEKIIEIDPGMSFGTGSHETTQFCLKAIEKLSTFKFRSFLDAGCGSGILAIGADMFGFSPVYAFDYDPESIESASGNFKRNKASQRIDLQQADIALYKPDINFDIVMANIISGILISNKARLMSWVKPKGCLVLAGILNEEYPKVREEFSTNGFVEIYSGSEKEWTGGVFHRGQDKALTNSLSEK